MFYSSVQQSIKKCSTNELLLTKIKDCGSTGYSITGCVRTVNILRWGKNVNKQCYPSSDHQEVRCGGGETRSTIMYTWT